ncbi:MAG: YegP family protein [Saprospiraceae bacterium]|nr:YegP family protein [Saprospiraceae bacterium]
MSSTEHKNDDYLICREYEEQIRMRSEKYPDMITFQHHNGKYYFAWINEVDQIVLRSEAYPSADSRDRGMESVLQNRVLKERYLMIESHGAYFLTLRAANHQEIGRSCPKNDEASLWNLIGGVAITESKSEASINSSNATSSWTNESGVSTDPLAPAFGPTPMVVHSTGPSLEDQSGTNHKNNDQGFNWWWIALIVILLLLYFFWNNSNKQKQVDVPAPTEQPVITEPSSPQPPAPPSTDYKKEEEKRED